MLSRFDKFGKLSRMTSIPHRVEPVPQSSADVPLELRHEQVPAADEAEWVMPEPEPEPRGAGGRAVLGWTLAVLAALWIAYTAWSAGRELAGQPLTSPAIAQWVAIATGPLAPEKASVSPRTNSSPRARHSFSPSRFLSCRTQFLLFAPSPSHVGAAAWFLRRGGRG